jgi:hypothetical protein
MSTPNKDIVLSAAYAFLAALTENQDDLYNHVYVPICRRAISLYNSRQGRNSGKWSDIQEVILAEYGINVPQIIMKQLINSVYKSMSSRERRQGEFRVFSNGEAFQFDKYTFIDMEESYQKGIRDANAFQEAFSEYLKTEGVLSNEVSPIVEFIEKNKRQIASFFGNSHTTIDNADASYYYHAEFLKYIELNNHNLYKIAENQYIGSLVASFLEAGLVLDPKFPSNEVYYIDTPIILRALDLQREDDTNATNDVLRLIKETGGKLKVLSITINETGNVIQDAIDRYNNSIPTSSINEACLRMGNQRTWLMKLLSDLEDTLKTKLGVTIEILPNSFIEKYSQNREIKDLQATRTRIGNARHDVLAYMYIRHLRGYFPSVFQKAKIWFLTTNDALLNFNKKNLIGSVPEIILSDSLTSLLWLKNPVKLKRRIIGTGLSVLLASTLHEEIANRELINEFDNALKSIDSISDDDYRTLLESVAHQSAKKIESFVKSITTDENKTKAEVQRIIEKERSRRNKEIEEKKDYQKMIADKNEQNIYLDSKLQEIEAKLSALAEVSKLKDEQSRAKEEKTKLKGKYIKWIIISLIIIIVFLILIIVNNKFGFFPKATNWIMSSGGLFGLGNFIINLIKFLRNK